MGTRTRQKIRRLINRVNATDADEMRRRIGQILPPRRDPQVPVLRLDSAADARVAPGAIVAAFLADEITAAEAQRLLDGVQEAVTQVRTATIRLRTLKHLHRAFTRLMTAMPPEPEAKGGPL
jgi:hypothetical protein